MSSKKSAVETAAAAPPPPCLICKRVAGSWAEMESHLAAAHVLYHPHQCSQCEFNSPHAIAMAEHANETRHRGRFYERDYDFYKHRCVERLMGDHRKRATPVAGAVRTSAAAVEVGEAPKKRPPVAVKIEQCEEVGETPRAEGTAVGAVKRVKGGDGKVAKPARKTVTCRYKECGVEVDVKQQHRHIEGAHMKSVKRLCPVQQCPSRAGSEEPHSFSRLEILKQHIKKAHGGVDVLGVDEKSRFDAMTKSVKGKVKELWPQCYPDRVQRRERDGGKTGGVAKKRKGD